jgi:hypothetical protein
VPLRNAHNGQLIGSLAGEVIVETLAELAGSDADVVIFCRVLIRFAPQHSASVLLFLDCVQPACDGMLTDIKQKRS